MGVSRILNELLADSIQAYVDNPFYVVEAFAQNAADIEERQDIPVARIAIYESQEATISERGRGKPTMSTQNYSVDVSVVRAYRGDKASEGEYYLLDVMDEVKEWAKQIEVAEATNGALYNLRYISSGDSTRNERYVTRTITLQAKRDLFFDQRKLTELEPPPGIITDDNGEILTDGNGIILYG